MFNHLLVCKVVPTEKVHPSLFKGCDSTFRALPRNKMQRVLHNKVKTEEQVNKNVERLLKKEDAKKEKMAEYGYAFGGYRADFEGTEVN